MQISSFHDFMGGVLQKMQVAGLHWRVIWSKYLKYPAVNWSLFCLHKIIHLASFSSFRLLNQPPLWTAMAPSIECDDRLNWVPDCHTHNHGSICKVWPVRLARLGLGLSQCKKTWQNHWIKISRLLINTGVTTKLCKLLPNLWNHKTEHRFDWQLKCTEFLTSFHEFDLFLLQFYFMLLLPSQL